MSESEHDSGFLDPEIPNRVVLRSRWGCGPLHRNPGRSLSYPAPNARLTHYKRGLFVPTKIYPPRSALIDARKLVGPSPSFSDQTGDFQHIGITTC